MSKIVGIIGSKGFVGSNVKRAYRDQPDVEVVDIDTRSADSSTTHPKFDVVYFCAGNPRIYISNENPQECLKRSVIELIQYLTGLEYDKFVLVSTWLVYPVDEPDKRESLPIDIGDLSIYGAHKYLAECYVRKYAGDYVIFRPTGFFGPGLKKGLLYDLKSRAKVYRESADSYIDGMEIGRFCSAVINLGENLHNVTLNIGSGFSISARELLEFAPADSDIKAPKEVIDCRTLNLGELNKHMHIYDSEEEAREEMFKFLELQPTKS